MSAAPYKGIIAIAYSNNWMIQGATSNDMIVATTNSNQSIIFGSSNTSNIFMKMSSNGFVGIGKSNPICSLDVFGDINFTTTITKNGAAFTSSQWGNNSSNLYIYGSNVGIGGTTLLEGFDIQGLNAKIGCNLYVMSNLSIGKSNPGYALDVVGSINFTSGLYQNGATYSTGTNTNSLACAQVFSNLSNITATTNSNSSNFTLGSGSKLLIASYDLWASTISQATTTFAIYNSSNTFITSNVSFDPIYAASAICHQNYQTLIPNSTLGPGSYYVKFGTTKNSSVINTFNCYLNCKIINLI